MMIEKKPVSMYEIEIASSDVLLSFCHRHRYVILLIGAFFILLLQYLRFRKCGISSSASRGSHPQPEPKIISRKVEKPDLDLQRLRVVPKRIAGSRPRRKVAVDANTRSCIQPRIFYATLTGSTEKRVQLVVDRLQNKATQGQSTIKPSEVYNLADIDLEDFFVVTPRCKYDSTIKYFYIFILPSYNIDTILDTFIEHLRETHHDFRINTASLSGLAGYSVFGLGDREGWKTERAGYCSQAVEVDKWMAKLTGRKRAFPLGMGDVKRDAAVELGQWAQGLQQTLEDIAQSGGLGEGVPGSGDPVESDEEEEDDDDDDVEGPGGVKRITRPARTRRKGSELGDLEDIRGVSNGNREPIPVDFTSSQSGVFEPNSVKEMVPKTSPTYVSLTKQGYSIIGSHSGVKICRWTKSALRGRGSCYKYSFYGIKSHLCMETTPSLSCSNKCVFCWRHGTNPVGTTWRWQVDPPDMIFAGAKEAHLKKIKMLRGVPGLRAERFQEAMHIRHCALSLVGEPIFYPHINEFLALLHSERISSFLVCNAQHPEHLNALHVVTQLYVSIDASNKESLRKIDRPLHRDFWDRFLRCLDILREKRFRMRTVYRLTLVKGFNIEDEVEGYADLVARGLPCFVEIKGVTYCGTSTSARAGLTMQNVPFYEEVTTFVEALDQALTRRGLDYGIAAEHAHSCCILLGSRRFFIEGKWHTLIDYDQFFRCLESGQDFAPEDYVGPPTPEWATWGHGGFDPADERVDRKGRKITNE